MPICYHERSEAALRPTSMLGLASAASCPRSARASRSTGET